MLNMWITPKISASVPSKQIAVNVSQSHMAFGVELFRSDGNFYNFERF
jgi:hypothetical protein